MRRLFAPACAVLAVMLLLAGCGPVTVKPTSFTLTGTVTYGGTTDPVVGATVSVAGASGTTNAAGSYSITGTYTDSWQEITVSGAQAADFSDYIDLSPSASQNLAVRKLYYVDPDAGKGNDANDGSAAHPLRTITCALDKPEDKVVQLTAGTYGEASGETFPLVIEDKEEIRGVAGDATACVITRTSADGSLVDYNEDPGLNSFRLSYVTLDLQGAKAQGQYCLKIAGGHGVQIAHCRFQCHSKVPYGIWIADGASLVSIDDCTFDKARIGVYLRAAAASANLSLTLAGSTMTACDDGVYVDGTHRADLVEVRDCTISGGLRTGITFLGVSLIVRDSTISGYGDEFNLGTGIEVTNGSFLLRGSQIINNTGSGIFIFSLGEMDLGTSASPGNNTLTGNNVCNLWVNQPGGSLATTVYAVGNNWDAPQPTGIIAGPASSAPNYNIPFAGHSVQFS